MSTNRQHISEKYGVVDILGVHIHPVKVTDLHSEILDVCARGEKALITHVNVQALNIAYQQSWMQLFLNQSALVFCDGFGVKWGAKILGYHIPERITYADWTWQLAEFAERCKLTLYFLGSRPGTAERASHRLRERYPRLQIVGTQHGYFDKTVGGVENEAVIRSINNAKPCILVVGFGMPLQERWLMENWKHLDVNVALTGGAVFDYISGNLRRGPRWMTDYGLEWLSRLIIEPQRLWRRYILGNPLFLCRVIKQRLAICQLRSG